MAKRSAGFPPDCAYLNGAVGHGGPSLLTETRTMFAQFFRSRVVFALLYFLCAASAEAQSRTEPVTLELWNQRLQIGPVPGLTTVWHRAPVRTAIPLGATVQFRIQIPPDWGVNWTGAHAVGRNRGWSTAEVTFSSLGEHTVSVLSDGPQGELITERAVFDVLNTAIPATVGYDPIKLTALHLTADSVVIDPQLPNASAMGYFFRGSSLAALHQVGEDRYSTSANRALVAEAVVQPIGFAPLIEWRLDGIPQQQLGSPVRLEIFTTGQHTLSAGPLEEEKKVKLDTYRVRITSQPSADDIARDLQVTYRAETDPSGYENDITWLAATKYGSAQPWTATGPEFTVRFADTVGAEGRWLGVRADDASRTVEQRQATVLPILSPLACKLAARSDFFNPEEVSSLNSFCKGTIPIDVPDCDQCVVKWLGCTGRLCLPDGSGDELGGFLGGLRQGCRTSLNDNLSCTIAYDYCLHRCKRPDPAAGTWCCESCTFGAVTKCSGCKATGTATKCDDSLSGTLGRPTQLDCPGISGQTGESVTCVK
jgi:hypothetical protein